MPVQPREKIAPPAFLDGVAAEPHIPAPPHVGGVPDRRRTLEYLMAVSERHGGAMADSYQVAVIEDNAGTAAERRGVKSMRIWKRYCPPLYGALRAAGLYTTYNKSQDAVYVKKITADDPGIALTVLRSLFPLILYAHDGLEYPIRSALAKPVLPDNLPTLIEPTIIDLSDIARQTALIRDDITGVYVFSTEHGIGVLGEFIPIEALAAGLEPRGELTTRHPSTVVRIATKASGPLYAMYLTRPKELTPLTRNDSAIAIARDFIDATGEPHVWQAEGV